VSRHTPLWLWIVVSAAILAAVVAWRVRPWGRDTGRGRSLAWFVAGAGSAAMLALTAARVIASMPRAAAIEDGALAVAGALTGVLLGIELTRREQHPLRG